MPIFVHLTTKSSNAKTGPIPVSTTEDSTCPDSCPLKRGGCYARSGPLALHWKRVSQQQRGTPFSSFLSEVRGLPPGQLWRHNQAGDLPGTGDLLDAAALAELVKANQGRNGFTYTHKPVLGNPVNAAAIREANQQGFTINLSANTLLHADSLAALNIGPVVTLLPSSVSGRQRLETPAGRRVVVCPATYMEDVSCSSCKLCADATRSVIVGFPAHGSQRKQVDALDPVSACGHSDTGASIPA